MNTDLPNCGSTYELLKARQKYSLKGKIYLSEQRIIEWYEHWEGQVYVSFSGGKDSTVLLDLVRNIYPEVPALFADTGLEYPEIRKFVKTIDNVTWIRPKKPFHEVIKQYGYPVVSKMVSMGLSRYKNTKSDVQKQLRLFGGINPTSGKKQHPTVPKKWHYLKDAPFDVTERCCDFFKKEPFRRYEKQTGRKPFIGSMAAESNMRKLTYLKNGCLAFEGKKPKATPMAFWLEDDIWEYIKTKDIPYSKIYDMGEKRTGCMFCMFGVHMEKGENRFQRMKKTHPNQYNYCINKLGLGKVLDFMGIKY